MQENKVNTMVGITVWQALRGQQSVPRSPDYEGQPMASTERPTVCSFKSRLWRTPYGSTERPKQYVLL
ncbi:hypothetical protein E3N88_00371 [Mikania micrantha]|uniref:Uncharacterized protein n=1 Tax=Mikania micrantha TaxID=192012 RepID=A0A5N6PXW9_9ASTR|nr:hypothetical protein E3N88_00371 [Mikania micrantha]